MDDAAAPITALLTRISEGDDAAASELVPLVYHQLERIARGYVAPHMSIEPLGLVHELYLRLAQRPLAARDRHHFYATCARAMRQILADRARGRRAAKRGGDPVRVSLTTLASGPRELDVVAVDAALDRLEALSPRQARIVELRCLVGMSVAEAAAVLGVSERTVHAEWRLARAWLSRALDGAGG